MKSTLTIPQTIKVGFQNRDDTYTGKLAYVIYTDQKGKLRKEGSWTSWRDKEIAVEDYDNEPTSGFVLNRDVGGTQRSWSWDARREKVRVYDPRGFEIEISVENLLFILQECSAIKGKGLEGDFVYSWSGPELVLLPVESQEFKSSTEHGKLQTKKVTAKEMEAGCTYLSKDEKNLMYMGRHVWHTIDYDYKSRDCNRRTFMKKCHVFLDLDYDAKDGVKSDERRYILYPGFTKLAVKTSDRPIDAYPDAYEKMMKSPHLSKPVKLTVKPKKVDLDHHWFPNIVVQDGDNIMHCSLDRHYKHGSWFRVNQKAKEDEPILYDVLSRSKVSIEDDGFMETSYTRFTREKLTAEEVLNLSKKLVIKYENGSVETKD
jgi:hypothetical protein